MTSLPRTRPVRRSSKRGELAPAAAVAATATAKKSKAKGAANAAGKSGHAKPKGKSKSKTASKAASNGSGSSARASAASAPRSAAQAEEPPAPPKRKVPAAGYAAPSSSAGEPDSAMADLVTTTLQAAHELAQIGLDVGRAAVRSMLDRLPKA